MHKQHLPKREKKKSLNKKDKILKMFNDTEGEESYY
jgi:hypothetical protein